MTGQKQIQVNELVDAICKAIAEKQIPKFADGKVPMKVAQRVTGKSAIWIQTGIIMGWFPVGIAVKNDKQVTSIDEIKSNERIDYTIFPKAFWEQTGYVWQGEKE